MQHACYMQFLTEYMQIVTCLLLWLTICMFHVTCRDLGRFFHMLHAGCMQASVMPTCATCFMTVTCRRDAWSLHVTSMLPVHNMQVSCMQHAEFIQITSMEHAEFIQITCMQHAEFIQITCMQHDDFLHVLYMLKFYKKKTVLHSTSYRYKVHNNYTGISIFIPSHFISRKEKETNVINSYKYP